jgi:hypothetical protein
MTKEQKEKDLLDLLDIIIHMFMLVEKIEGFQIENHYNKMQIKSVLNKALQVITPLAERDYQIVFRNGESETLQIMSEYENLIAQIRDFNVPQKVILTQMIQAFNLERGVIEATTHRILKKHSKKDDHAK